MRVSRRCLAWASASGWASSPRTSSLCSSTRGVRVGNEVILGITQHGKVCHDRCAIYHLVGDCVMPREGIFAKVIRGSRVKAGNKIKTNYGGQ